MIQAQEGGLRKRPGVSLIDRRRRWFIKTALAAASAGLPSTVSPQTEPTDSKQETSKAARKHTLVVLDPGHFHAALTLRKSHPRLNDDVYVYAENGPDVESFLRIVQTFNERPHEPTRWKLHVYRGADYLERLRSERAGDVVIIAGKNNSKMTSIHRLHADGFGVLGDKPWLISASEIAMLAQATAAPPLAMDIMTERHEITCQLQKALVAQPAILGHFRTGTDQPAIEMRSVHHLYKIVNNRPLVRPGWFFDVGVQGEGITDVTTHLVDLAQWMTGGGKAFEYHRDVELLAARQWPTAVPRDMFERITGLNNFPGGLSAKVVDGALQYLCNAALSYRLRGIPIGIESIWALAVPEGGGDTHWSIARGTRADIVVDQGPDTGFLTRLSVHPIDANAAFTKSLRDAIASLQDSFPGIDLDADGGNFRIKIPDRLRTTHEEHFAAVLEEFLSYLDSGGWPDNLGGDLITKYTLLGRAAELSQRSG